MGRNSIVPTYTDVKRMYILYHNACGYKTIFYKLVQDLNEPDINDCFRSQNLLFGCMVTNGMFAIEMFLKFIYAQNHIINDRAEFYKWHDIWDLYKKLDRKNKRRIRIAIDSSIYRFMRKFRCGNSAKRYADTIELRYLTSERISTYKINLNYMIKILNIVYNISAEYTHGYPRYGVKLPKFSYPALTEDSVKTIQEEGIEFDDSI